MTSKLTHSKLTLRPNSKEDRELFWQQCCDDIAESLMVTAVIAGLAYVTYFCAYLADQNEGSLNKVLINTMFFLPYLVMCLIGRCFQKYLAYALPLMFAFEEITSCMGTQQEASDLTLTRALWMTFWVMQYCVLLAPTMLHTFAYITIFLTCAFWKMIKLHGGTDAEKFEFAVFVILIGAISSFFTSYTL